MQTHYQPVLNVEGDELPSLESWSEEYDHCQEKHTNNKQWTLSLQQRCLYKLSKRRTTTPTMQRKQKYKPVVYVEGDELPELESWSGEYGTECG